MKKLAVLSAIALSGLIYSTADAQISIHLGFGFHPHRVVYEPAPVVVEQAPVYDEQAPVFDNSNNDYYYLPDVDAYYSVNEQCYYYNDGNTWVPAAYLPGQYHDYDWRNVRRYEVRAPRPYLHNDFYRSRYEGREFHDWDHHNFDNHFRDGNGYAGGFNHDGFRGHDDHFDNRNQNWNNRPAERYRGNGQHFDNRQQGGFSQPSRQNNEQHDSRGGNERFSGNNPRGGFNDHRMTKF